MSEAGTGIVIQTSPPSQATTTNASPSTTTPASGPARRRHKQILKCTQCRLDKQRCTPVERLWPNRCDRCVKYNHSCSPGLNAREERRRQAPSSFPLSFRTPPPHGEGKGRSETLSPAPAGGQYGANTAYMMRVPSPGTASSTGGSDDDQGDHGTGYKRAIQGGNRGGIPGYQVDNAPQVGQSSHLAGPPMMDGHISANNERLTDPNNEVTSYLNCLIQSSCDLPSPSILHPTAPVYTLQPNSHSSGYTNYSYFPLNANQDHPPSRARSPTSRTLHTRFTQFWAHLHPLGIVCPGSPKFTNTIHTIFTHYVPLYAEADDMVNHALMAFSAADAGINAGREWGRKLNIAGWRHAGRCQRMLGVRLGKLKLGPSPQRAVVTDTLVSESEITAVRLGIFLMLFYGLCIGDASLIKLTSQLLALSKTIPAHPTSSNSPTTIPIASHYTDLPDGGYQVRISLDHGPDGDENEELGLLLGNDTQVFTQIRREYESRIAPEILWEALQEDEGDDEGEEEDEEDGDEDPSGMGLGGRVENEDVQRTAQRTKQHHELPHLSTASAIIRNIPTAQSGITPTSATTLSPNMATVNFAELGSASYPPPPGAYRVPVPANHSHLPSLSQPQTHQLPQLATQSPSSAATPFLLDAAGYTRAPPSHMYSATIHSYPATGGDISLSLPMRPQVPVDASDSSIRHMQRHMNQNMDL